MPTPWMIAFAALSLIAVVDTLLLLGVLRNIASLEHRMRLAGFDDTGSNMSDMSASGPDVGSRAPEIRGTPINIQSSTPVDDGQMDRHLLLVFLSTSCASCQRIVAPLNDLAHQFRHSVETMVVMKADLEGVRNFLSVFSIDCPVYLDAQLDWPGEDPIRFVPYWTLYDHNGVLVQKNVINHPDEMTVLTELVEKEVRTRISTADPLTAVRQ